MKYNKNVCLGYMAPSQVRAKSDPRAGYDGSKM